MRLFIVYDSDYNIGERIELAVVMKDKQTDEEIGTIIDNIKDEYYKKVEDDGFAKQWCLESYVANRLDYLGYKFIDIGGEIDLS